MPAHGTCCPSLRWGSIVRLIDALVGDGTYGTTRAVRSRSSVGPVHHDRVECAVRHQSESGLQVAGPIRSEGGRDGLGDRSRAPQHCPHKITDAVATLICEARRQHPNWGPDKLLDWLSRRHPALDLPAVSTAGDLLAEEIRHQRRNAVGQRIRIEVVVQRVVAGAGVETDFDVVIATAVMLEQATDVLPEVPFHFQDQATHSPCGIRGAIRERLLNVRIQAGGGLACTDRADDGDTGVEAAFGHDEPARRRGAVGDVR
jgi:hypothetical protein